MAIPNPKQQNDNKALDKRLGEIRKLLSEGIQRDAQTKYQVGKIVDDLMRDSNKYGTHAVEYCAQELGLHPETLRGYASVARTWSKQEFARLLKQRTSSGLPLSMSHLIELARVESDKRRAQLGAQVVAEGLSVRDLRDRLATNSEKGAHGDANGAKGHRQQVDAAQGATGQRTARAATSTTSPAVRLVELINSADDLIEKQTRCKDAMPKIQALKPSKALADQITKVIERSRALRALCDEIEQLLIAEQQRVAAGR